MSPSLLLSQSRLNLSSPHEIGRATTFHANGLAWLFLAWLGQILLLIKVPTQTLKNHIDTHHG
jgi:hypothetical protein